MGTSGEETPLRFGLQCLGLVLPLVLTANGCRPAFSEISFPSALWRFGMKAFREPQLMETMGAKLELSIYAKTSFLTSDSRCRSL